jgi:transcription elongation GreA/GreB family factor
MLGCMSDTTMDHGAKQHVKDALLERARAQFAASEESAEEHESAAELDQDSSLSVDDLSQADAAGGLTELFEESAAKQQADIATIEALDMGPKTTVSPGAIVGFDGGRYLIGVVADSVEVDGVTYEGISSDSPIHAAIEGLALGDSFTFRERTHTIDFLA